MSESSFPSSLDYSPNPLSISARAYESKCVPESSSTARPGEIVRIRVPSGRAGSYLNQNKSFLSFTLVNTSTAQSVEEISDFAKGNEDQYGRNYAKLFVDGSAYSVIQTQEVYNSSNLLESIQNANVLYNMLVDLQTSMSSRLTGSSILGIGATGLQSQAWSQYRAQTLVTGVGQEGIFSFNLIGGREWAFQAKRTAYTGLNILSTITVDDESGEQSPPLVVIANTDVDDNQLGNFSKAFTANIGPLVPPRMVTGTGGLNDPVTLNRCAIYDNGANQRNGWISRLGPVVPYGQKMKFTLPLVSGVVGSLCCKLFPLHALNSDLMLHLTLASANTVACNNYIPTHWNINVFDAEGDALPQGAPTGGSSSVKTIDLNSPPYPADYTPPEGSWKIDVNYRLEDIAFHANIVEISAQAQAMLDQATGGQYIIPSCSYRNFTHSLMGGQTNSEFPVPARFTSVKSMIACQRPSASLNRPDRFSLTCRIKNFMSRIQYRVGSLMVPQEPIRMENIDDAQGYVNGGKAPEAFCHLLEAVGQSVSDRTLECGMNDNIYGANHDLDYTYGIRNAGNTSFAQWRTSVDVGQDPVKFVAGTPDTPGQSDRRYYNRLAAGSQAGFCWGVDLESFNNAGCTGPMQSGTNTLGLNVMCRLYLESTTMQTGATLDTAQGIIPVTVDHWVMHDTVIVVSGGVASVRF